MESSNEAPIQPGSNIWGPKFPLFGFAVILLFVAIIGIRACYLGVPLGDVFRNTDPVPVTVDSTQNKQ